MNRGLTLFSFVLIVLGAVSSFYPVAILGGFFLIVAFLAPSRPPPPRPKSSGPERRRMSTPAAPPPIAAAALPQSQMQSQAAQARTVPSEAQGTVALPALFPATMFPTMNPMAPAQRPQDLKPPGEKAESRDEIVELAAVAVLLRLLSS